MKIKCTFKNVEASDELISYTEAQLPKFMKYQTKPFKRAQFTFSCEGHLYRVEVNLNGVDFSYKAKVTGKDFHSALDSAVFKIANQLIKRKEKVQNHKKPSPYRRKDYKPEPDQTDDYYNAA